MQSLVRSLRKPRRHHPHCYQHHRSCVDFAAIRHVRDRGLDHAVEREKHLKPVVNIKNLIQSEPAKSLPISIISQHKDSLKIPTRPIEFIRKYPLIFEEFLPGGIGIQPHIRLTPQVLDLDAEEQLVYQSESYRQDVAARLLKLLMISRIDKIPLKILDVIKWDLGLPQDYVKSIVPDFPDCFRVIGNKNLSSGLDSNLELELVCWSNEFAVSFMEKKVKTGEMVCKKGMPIAFPMQFSTGFEMDKQMKKWLDEWQKLPYISPYENATHLGPSSDESDKWAVGLLHEVLNLFVSKKVERDTLLYLGEWLGIRSRFKRALLHHPGIFYLSSKIGTYTVVLREAYKRGLLVEKNPVMNIRNQYIHLMNMVIEDRKAISVPGGSKQQEKKTDGKSEGREKEDSEDNVDDDDEEEEEEAEEKSEGKTRARRNAPSTSGRVDKKQNLDVRGHSQSAGRERMVEKHRDCTKGARRERRAEKHHDRTKDAGRERRVDKHHDGRERTSAKHHDRTKGAGSERTVEKQHGKTMNKVLLKDSSRKEMQKRHNFHGSSRERSTSFKSKAKLLTAKSDAT